MIRNQTDYRIAMCNMIRRVQMAKSTDEINEAKMSPEEAEILADSIESGFVRGRTKYLNSEGKEIELRNLKGIALPRVCSTVITLKGLEFLKPDRTKLKANLALIISVCSLVVSGLANLDKIITNLDLLLKLFQ